MNLFSKTKTLCFILLGASSCLNAQIDIEEIVVSAEFRPLPLMETPNSVSVITSAEITSRDANFLTEVLATAPNLNYSSGASRGRYFQIRGIGERSQFVDPLNPGVGLVIDGIDYSTLGAAATLFDMQQVEILRGPQGTLFGANALAGMINMRSNAASEDFEANITTGISNITGNTDNWDSSDLGVVVSGQIAEDLNGRLAVQKNKSDGFVENVYLGRDDTQNIDEQTIRGKLAWQVSDRLNIDFTLLKLDTNNGYDSFTLDNSRDTISDEPGTDALDSLALSTIATLELSEGLTLEANLATAQSDSEYSYDVDWTNPDICAGLACGDLVANPEYWGPYSYFDEYLRDTSTDTLDARLLSSVSPDGRNWVLGYYLKDQQQDLTRNYTPETQFQSEYSSQNVALYGETTLPLTQVSAINIGLRLASFTAEYSDNLLQNTDTEESLAGGHLTFEAELGEQHFGYARIARGYKTGGINDTSGYEIPLEYETETLWNYELGLKSILDNGINSQISLFYMDRSNAQVKQSLVTYPDDYVAEFLDYIDNAPKAHSYGVEAEIYWGISDRIDFNISLGLLQAKFDEYESASHVNTVSVDNGDGTFTRIPYDLSGEILAQAPEYQLSIGSNFKITENINLWAAYEAKDSFRFSNRHFAESDSYGLIHTRLVWSASENVDVSLWGRNLTNEDYTTRGFGSFPNDPRDNYGSTGPYYQFGEPREVGLSFEYRL